MMPLSLVVNSNPSNGRIRAGGNDDEGMNPLAGTSLTPVEMGRQDGGEISASPSRFHPAKSKIWQGTQGPHKIFDFVGYKLPPARGGRITLYDSCSVVTPVTTEDWFGAEWVISSGVGGVDLFCLELIE